MITFNIKNNILNNKSNEQYHLQTLEDDKLTIIDIDNDQALSQHYGEICRQYNTNHKWILMINPDEQPLAQLSKQGEINTANVLKVNANKVNVVISNIEHALSKGNCSVIVLCNPLLSSQEIEKLSICARLGKTKCIVIRNNRSVH
ncbi:hypothetical protein ACOYR1_07750 [Thalassotalea piscium]